MIKHRWHKAAASHMADIAVFICCYMGRRGFGVFAGCINTIVTGITPFTCNCRAIMVGKGIEETARVMAHGAIPACVAMNCCIRRPSGSSSNIIHTAIMARDTITSDTRVSEN
jgi:hypothetical protein